MDDLVKYLYYSDTPGSYVLYPISMNVYLKLLIFIMITALVQPVGADAVTPVVRAQHLSAIVDQGESASSTQKAAQTTEQQTLPEIPVNQQPDTKVLQSPPLTTPEAPSDSKSNDAPKSDPLKAKRELFVDALNALEAGQMSTFQELANRITDYILYPYLQYYELSYRTDTASDEEILRFIDANKDTPLSARLRTQWLHELADAQRWDMFEKVYLPQQSTRLQCVALDIERRKSGTGAQTKQLMQKVQLLWLVGNPQPKECDPLFEEFTKRKLATPKLIWEKIELAINGGNLPMAQELAMALGTRDRKLVDLWIQVYKDPENGIQLKSLQKNSLVTRKIVLHAIRRLALKDAEKARSIWLKIARRYGFSAETKGETQRYITLRAAYQNHPNAYSWLAAIDKKWVDENVRFWRATLALRQQNWKELKKNIKLMPQEEKKDVKWKYWLARAQERLGEMKSAKKLYAEVASETNYYGFLAADHLGLSYTFNHKPLEFGEGVIAEIEGIPGILRARELYWADRVTDARREWSFSTYRFNETKLKQAALLAHRWGWHDNAILTIARTSERSDLTLRFPTPYRDIISVNAQTLGIDPSWIYGVARRESAFKTDARSSKGALGLMQLMPGTARLESKRLGMDKPSQREILEADKNILLGSSYLNRMLERFGGHQVLVTAAYNAGPRRVDQWIPKDDAMEADI